MNITFLPISHELVKQTADLHVELMPDDLATGLGLAVVRDLFHGGTVDYPGGIGVVALCDAEVAGFCFAQVDFRAFSAFQRRKRLRFFIRVLAGLLRQPKMLPRTFGANRYLAMYPKFTNLGPLLVNPKFRDVKPDGVARFSLATELARRAFEEIRRRAPELPVLAMIRSSNMPSITACAQGAILARFKFEGKSPIYLGEDQRYVFEYRFAMQPENEP